MITPWIDVADVSLTERVLAELDKPAYVVRGRDAVTLTVDPTPGDAVLARVGPITSDCLGGPDFAAAHTLRDNYMCGAMANGIASEDLVIAMGQDGRLASFGAAGLLPERIDEALTRMTAVLGNDRVCVNVIHAPMEPALERGSVDMALKHGIRCVEASAFMGITEHLVRYRLLGVERGSGGVPMSRNRIIAKVSRTETARQFLSPPPRHIVERLVETGAVTRGQAELADGLAMADDITVEGDSGGHTDRRPLLVVLPSIVLLRDKMSETFPALKAVRIGAAGGLGTPSAVLAAFTSGAQYVVTGSVNQSCLEAGASEYTKRMLADAGSVDCEMAPAADMFELGVDLQVLRRGTMFPMRAKLLREIYVRYPSLDAISDKDRGRLEEKVFRMSLHEVWELCVAYFVRRDPDQLVRARQDPKARMALVFRWYLGMSSRWAKIGDPERISDYQIWCGPAMGAFNEWAYGSYLQDPANRRAADVAEHLMCGAAYEARANQLLLQGIKLPGSSARYRPGIGGKGAL